MARYLFSGCLTSREATNTASSGLRPSVQAILDLVDTTDPAWPAVAAVLKEFTDAGVELDASSVPLAVKLGRQRWATEGILTEEASRQTPLASGADLIVYYLRRSDLIKIGTTTNPAVRFGDLLPDEILAVEPGGRAEEVRRHRQFRHLRGCGEYFRDAPELRDHISSIRSMYGEPDPSWPTAANRARPRRAWELPLATSVETMGATEAASKLGIPESTIRQWAHRKRLPLAGRDERGRQIFYVEHMVLLRDSGRAACGNPR